MKTGSRLPPEQLNTNHADTTSWWTWPLPPAGPLELVCEWPAFGIAESRAVIDAQIILGAAARSIQLWPENEG